MPYSEGKERDWWDFGLWQCCRHSDGVCRGPRWPGKCLNIFLINVYTGGFKAVRDSSILIFLISLGPLINIIEIFVLSLFLSDPPTFYTCIEKIEQKLNA